MSLGIKCYINPYHCHYHGDDEEHGGGDDDDDEDDDDDNNNNNLLFIRRKLACEYDQMRLTIRNSLQFSIKLNQIKCWFLERGESNPGHIGGRRALSPLRQPCSPRCDGEGW